MKAETLINALEAIAIHDYIGVPDSTLKSFCDYLYLHKSPAPVSYTHLDVYKRQFLARSPLYIPRICGKDT